jgi:hypothetical protein
VTQALSFPAYLKSLRTNNRGEAEVTFAVPYTDVESVFQGLAMATGWFLMVDVRKPDEGEEQPEVAWSAVDEWDLEDA